MPRKTIAEVQPIRKKTKLRGDVKGKSRSQLFGEMAVSLTSKKFRGANKLLRAKKSAKADLTPSLRKKANLGLARGLRKQLSGMSRQEMAKLTALGARRSANRTAAEGIAQVGAGKSGAVEASRLRQHPAVTNLGTLSKAERKKKFAKAVLGGKKIVKATKKAGKLKEAINARKSTLRVGSKGLLKK